jgi:FixJ family two-component response regulator
MPVGDFWTISRYRAPFSRRAWAAPRPFRLAVTFGLGGRPTGCFRMFAMCLSERTNTPSDYIASRGGFKTTIAIRERDEDQQERKGFVFRSPDEVISKAPERESMSSFKTTVCIVDDDPSVLKSTTRLIESAGFRTKAFDNGPAFLGARLPRGPKCLILDLRMPGLGGLDLQREMAGRGLDMPIIFLTGHGNIHSSVVAMKAGAVDFLTKPVPAETLLGAVRTALEKDRSSQKQCREVDSIRERISTLSPREFETLRWVIAGRLNKQTAAEMGIREKTVKVHRAMVMRKMKADSVAELTILADRAGIEPMKKPARHPGDNS